MGLGQYNSLGEYCGPHTASSVFLILVPTRSLCHSVPILKSVLTDGVVVHLGGGLGCGDDGGYHTDDHEDDDDTVRAQHPDILRTENRGEDM